jgi:hypothetical protein
LELAAKRYMDSAQDYFSTDFAAMMKRVDQLKYRVFAHPDIPQIKKDLVDAWRDYTDFIKTVHYIGIQRWYVMRLGGDSPESIIARVMRDETPKKGGQR